MQYVFQDLFNFVFVNQFYKLTKKELTNNKLKKNTCLSNDG